MQIFVKPLVKLIKVIEIVMFYNLIFEIEFYFLL